MPDSLLKRLEKNATKSPDKDVLAFLGSGPNGGVIENKLTYSDIEKGTNDLALNLLSSGLKKGDL